MGVGEGGSGTAASLGAAIAINQVTNHSKAFVDHSTVTAVGGVTLSAVENASITALTIGGAVAAGANTGGGNATGVALAGAGSGNTVKNDTEAYVLGGSVTASAGPITITATDTSTITANGGGVGIAVAGTGGGNGVAVSVGISAASNDVENSVLAYVDSSTVAATNGAVALSRDRDRDDPGARRSAARSASAPAEAATASAWAQRGPGSGNTIKDTVEAYIQNGSTVTAGGGDLTLTALDKPTIVANGGGVGISVGAASGNGVGVSLGVSVAINDVEDPVKAFIDASKATASAPCL